MSGKNIPSSNEDRQLSLFDENAEQRPFDQIRHIDEQGSEYWFARELMAPLEYKTWHFFVPVLEKAKTSLREVGLRVEDHMLQVQRMVSIGSGAQRSVDDVKLSRRACHLIAMNGDPRKPIIAEAQNYFVIQTHKQEYIEDHPEWAIARLSGVVSRKAFTAALVETVLSLPSNGIAIATNDVYQGVLHHSAKELREILKTKYPRDKMTIPALSYLSITEWVCSERIGNAEELSFETARMIIQDVAGMIGAQADELSQRMGLDLVTGKPLLKAG